MSRIAKYPVNVPSGVEVKVANGVLNIKGPKGRLEYHVHPKVKLVHEGQQIKVDVADTSSFANAMSGTTRAQVSNMVTGVTKGFERKMTIIGVGYRAAVQGKNLNLTLGFSHPVAYPIPEGITIECPDQNNIVVKGADKQLVGQVSADIRAYRSPEPYKGKGVRYTDERVVKKEAKKK